MSVTIPNIDSKYIMQVVRDEFMQAGQIIESFAQANTHGTDYRPGIRASVKSRNLYGGRNKTNKLYSQTGALLRAMSIGKLANIFSVEEVNKEIAVKYGIDLDKVPYARIHEFGGTAGRGAYLRPRPYIVPAIKEFMKKEVVRVIQNIARRIT